MSVESMFLNPYWQALQTEQAALAIGAEQACRFPADVIPFLGVKTPDEEGMRAARDLLALGETIYTTGDSLAKVPGLQHVIEIPGLQMHFRGVIPKPQGTVAIRELGSADANAMVALTLVAFPGFFRQRTCILGRYFGVEVEGELVAMAGERLSLPGFREISAVCTRPGHTGRGYAALLIAEVLRVQAAAGVRSFLQVAASNGRAIALYERLGFQRTAKILFHKLRRN